MIHRTDDEHITYLDSLAGKLIDAMSEEENFIIKTIKYIIFVLKGKGFISALLNDSGLKKNAEMQKLLRNTHRKWYQKQCFIFDELSDLKQRVKTRCPLSVLKEYEMTR